MNITPPEWAFWFLLILASVGWAVFLTTVTYYRARCVR